MPRICYTNKRFSLAHAKIISKAREILEEYVAMGFTSGLTLRQLYYQFVARGILPNKQKVYKRLGDIIGDARLCGLIDWLHIEDRTRNLADLQHFDGPEDALKKVASWYHVDMWDNQAYRPEVWIEKDALTGVIQGVCQENDVPYFSCRGYTSLSEMWRAAQRIMHHAKDEGKTPYIIHFGDHDPSGMDMSRDIFDRLQKTFMVRMDFKRVALNMDQIEEYSPPPNPAKVTDSRYAGYVAQYGEESWELDALDPPQFRVIIEHELEKIRDQSLWDKDVAEKVRVKEQLVTVSKEWNEIIPNRKELEKLRKDIEEVRVERDKAQQDLVAWKKRNRRKKE